jgi:predicted peroxiredoxin
MAKKTAIVCNGSEPGNAFPTFILGSAAAALGDEVIIFVTPVAAAKLLKKGTLENINIEGMPNLVELYNSFQELGGKVILCELAFDVHKDLKKEDLREGVEILGGAKFMSDISDAQVTFSF